MRIICVTLLLSLAFSAPALAYVGPGLGLSAIGAVLGILLTVMLAVLGFIWYPAKRLLRKRGRRENDRETERR